MFFPAHAPWLLKHARKTHKVAKFLIFFCLVSARVICICEAGSIAVLNKQMDVQISDPVLNALMELSFHILCGRWSILQFTFWTANDNEDLGYLAFVHCIYSYMWHATAFFSPLGCNTCPSNRMLRSIMAEDFTCHGKSLVHLHCR